MKYFTATVLSGIAAVALAASGAQAVEKTKAKTGQKADANVESSAKMGSGEYWWNDANAVEDAESRYGSMSTGLDKASGTGTGAASGETGASQDAPDQLPMENDDSSAPAAPESAPTREQ